MVTIDGSLLVGVAAILSSLGGLWRGFRPSRRMSTDADSTIGSCQCCQCRAPRSGSGVFRCGAHVRSTPECQPAKPL